jgi:hypothetical protein
MLMLSMRMASTHSKAFTKAGKRPNCQKIFFDSTKGTKKEPRKNINCDLRGKQMCAHAYAEHTYGHFFKIKTLNVGVF